MKKISLLSVFVLLTGILLAQNSVQNLEHFTIIDAFGPFEIELIKSDNESVNIDYRGIDSEDLVVEVSHETLKLKIRNRHYINDWRNASDDYYRNNDYVRVKIYYKDIDAIEVEAGTKVFSHEKVKSKNLDLIVNMGAEVELELLAQNVGIQSSMGGIVRLSGKTDNLEIRTSMGSEVRTNRLEARIAFVKASMGSDVRLWVTDEIDASAGWGAVIDYSGSPSVRHSSTSMGAEISGYRKRN